MRAGTVTLVCLLAGCGSGLGLGQGGATDGSGCPVAGSALPDPAKAIAGQEHACEEAPLYEQYAVAGATTYYLGDFELDDCGEVTGTETWLLYANPKWVEADGYDCQVVWTVSGSVTEPTELGDYGITFTATVDQGLTDCPEDSMNTPVYDGSTSFEVSYDVEVGDGKSTVFFADSGTYLGEGEANDGHLTYVSDMNCKYF